MKIIELLNRIANGIDIPLQIKYDNDIWKYDEMARDYLLIDKSGEEYLICEELNLMYALNEEVEIIEEDKKIEPILIWKEGKDLMTKGIEGRDIVIGELGKIIISKINEIIDKLNKMEKE